MVNKVSNGQNNCQGNDDSPETLTEEDIEFSGEGNYVISGSKPKTLIRLVNPHQALIFKTGRSLDYRIPKPMVSLDEKYLRGCLESIHFRASVMTGDAFLLENLIMTPLETKTREGFGSPGVLVGPTGQWILGSGSVVTGVSSKGGDFFHRPRASDPISSADDRPIHEPRPRALSVSSSPMRLDRGSCAPAMDRRKTPTSASSTNSSSSDRTSSPLPPSIATIGQGMIKRSGGGGAAFRRFVFSVDDRREVYVATLSSYSGEKGPDSAYSFHEISGSGGGSRLLGKMTVSTLIAVDKDGSRLSETEFVLSGGGGDLATSSAPSPSTKHRGGLSKKVADVFKLSKLSGPIPMRENGDLDLDGQDREMAAIVVRAREEETHCGGGGWGLKFLEKVKVSSDGGDRPTRSVDVLIPAGPHGGPRARNGGSSSIVERWRSGGRCDCGGWDMGCPLTVLTPKSNNEDNLDEGNLQEEEFKSFDLITKGSGHSDLKLRVVTVRDDLYFVHFQRTLSILQSFSIAVAIIHSRSPSLRPKDVHEIK